jgi:hypothetical protein
MSAKGKKAARKTDELLDARQKRRFQQLNVIERLLVRKLLDELNDQLEEANGRITSKKGFVSLASAVDRVFDVVEGEQMGGFAMKTAKDMGDLLEFNARYYKTLNAAPEDRYNAIRESVDAQMRKRLGLDTEGGVVKKGYLDQLFRTEPARDEVKKMVAKAVSAGIPMRKLRKQLQVKVAGTKAAAGVLERHIGTFVLDAYQTADAITNQEFAKRLDLQYFIYSGGLIETTREFCRKRNNRVYTTKEAETWDSDPTLPKTKAEKDSGVVTDYVPLQDRGRWNCRHRILYITEDEAFLRRPELEQMAKGKKA